MNMTQFLKWLVRGSLLAGAIVIAPVAAAADEFSVESVQGEVEAVDVATNQFVVGGVRYNVAIDAEVELGGSYGAFTMLAPGQKVELKVRRYVDTDQLEVVSVKELAAGLTPKQY